MESISAGFFLGGARSSSVQYATERLFGGPAGVDGFDVGGGEGLGGRAVGVHDVDLFDAVVDEDEGDVLAVGRPGGVLMIGGVGGKLANRGAVDRSAQELLFAGDDHDVDHLLAVGGEGGVHEGGVGELVSEGQRLVLGGCADGEG